MSSGEARDDGLARADGFAPIESYGVVGDSKSIALVARDGAIDWWAAPAMASPPVCAAILDPRDGGCFTLEPAVPYRVSRRYLPGTNVLETTFSTRDGTVRVIEAWRRWCETVPYRGSDRELVLRSVLALKLLTFSPTGAMAAAATTSLPERVGGDRNYDYRYAWIRDTSFVLDSFIRLGLMLSCISATAPEIHPFYGLSGHVYRFTGARDIEGAFVACSFWLIDALVRNGQAGAFLGNLPQGLSHLSLLNAAALLDEQRGDDGLEQAE
jgi:GH15 family glucan-1,4-alpha-glucosidase